MSRQGLWGQPCKRRERRWFSLTVLPGHSAIPPEMCQTTCLEIWWVLDVRPRPWGKVKGVWKCKWECKVKPISILDQIGALLCDSILPHELDIVQISFSCLLPPPPPFLERKKMMRNGIKVIQWKFFYYNIILFFYFYLDTKYLNFLNIWILYIQYYF